jgi:hypothetical protein
VIKRSDSEVHGFLHVSMSGGMRHLPRNARGVIYAADADAKSDAIIYTTRDIAIVSKIPLSRSAEFSIEDVHGNVIDEAQVDLISAQVVNGVLYTPFKSLYPMLEDDGEVRKKKQTVKYERAYLSQDEALTECLVDLSFYKPGGYKACGKYPELLSDNTDLANERTVQELISNGKLKDISDQYANISPMEGVAAYRVGPKHGFLAGKTYVIRRRGEGEQRGGMVKVLIDNISISMNGKRYTLVSSGLLKEYNIGEVSSGIRIMERDVKFVLPAEYESYLDALEFSIEDISPNPAGILGRKFGVWSIGSQYYGTPRLGGFSAVIKSASVSVNCANTSLGDMELHRQLVGRIAFLELSDDFYPTNTLGIGFGAQRLAECNSARFSKWLGWWRQLKDAVGAREN